MTMTKAVGN